MSNETKWKEMSGKRGKKREKEAEEREEGEGREKELELLLIILIKKKVTSMLVPQSYSCSLQRESYKRNWRDFVGFSYGSASVWIVTQIEPQGRSWLIRNR